jgi:hypothetical protein
VVLEHLVVVDLADLLGVAERRQPQCHRVVRPSLTQASVVP